MFQSGQAHRSFLTVVMTYILDSLGYSIVFPVLAPLLLNSKLHFFAAHTSNITKTTILGSLFAVFGIAQLIGSPIAGAVADHYGRFKTFLATTALSILGYGIMALSIYTESIAWLFIGRILTGFSSGNVALAQSATADLTQEQYRSKAFGILLGSGAFGYVAGPWIGGKLANPEWLQGSAAFIFAAVAAVLNFFMILFFFKETWVPRKEDPKAGLLSTFKDLHLVLRHPLLRTLLVTYLFFTVGWAFFFVFSPTFLVQRFSAGSSQIGDFFAYMALCSAFVALYLNQELTAKFSMRTLSLIGMLIGALSLVAFVCPTMLWPYWIIFPINQFGGTLGWVNLGALLSMSSPPTMQGRIMGVGGSMWSLGQAVAPLIAGPVSGWNIYLPLLIGAASIFFAFIYFLIRYQRDPS